MAHIFKLKNSEGSTLVDFANKAGTGNPGSCGCQIRHLHWASREPETLLVQPENRDGGWLARARQGLKQSQHLIYPAATSKDSLLTFYNSLNEYLKDGKGKYFEYQLSDASDLLYLDFTHGWTDALMREDSGFWVEVDNADHGLPLVIVHQPYFRLDEIDAALNKLTNATMLVDEDNDGRPADLTWEASAVITDESIANGFYNFTIADANVRSFFQVVDGAVPGDIWTGSFDAYTDDATNARVSVRVTFLDSGDNPLTGLTGTVTTPSTDPDNPTRVTVTTAAAPALTTQVQILLRSENTSAASVVHHWRHANLSRTTTDPVFRVGVETVSNDPATTTSGVRGRAFPVVIKSDGPVRARLKLEGNGVTWGNPARVAVLPLSHPADSLIWLNSRKHQNLAGATLSNGATAVADGFGSGSGTNTVNIPGASAVNLTTNFLTQSITTNLAGLRGKWCLFLRCRGTVGSDDWSVLVKWGTSSATHPMPIKYLPGTGTGFTDVPIGVFNLLDDTDPFKVSFNLYARRDAGSGDLRANIFSFVPCDQLAALSGPFDAALLGTTDVAISDPEMGAVEILNSSLQFLDFAQVSGSTPFVLEPGLHMLNVFDSTLLQTVKASLVYSPTRHS